MLWECLVELPGTPLPSDLALTHTLEGSCSSTWSLSPTSILDVLPDFWSQPGLGLALGSIWESIKGWKLSACLYLYYYLPNKMIMSNRNMCEMERVMKRIALRVIQKLNAGFSSKPANFMWWLICNMLLWGRVFSFWKPVSDIEYR